ncbi:hypothetical protein OUZ56_016764 [Daphnia magna]|uniref:Uncharacterized protein n=1 Tax=Daphnia magna TaxID=35525 RepID=A0ABR0ARJ0_9CRUS|nr:hypothetical protein OUZ56_016764 [Daphnia magna]
MSSITRIIYEIETEFYVYFDNGDIKREKLALQAIDYETYLDAVNLHRKNYMAKNWIHSQTQLLHEKTILNEQQFNDILKKHISTPKTISMEVHICVEKPNSGWHRFIPEESRKLYSFEF